MDSQNHTKPVDAFHVDVLNIVGHYSIGENIYLEISDNLVVKLTISKMMDIIKEENYG